MSVIFYEDNLIGPLIIADEDQLVISVRGVIIYDGMIFMVTRLLINMSNWVTMKSLPESREQPADCMKS